LPTWKTGGGGDGKPGEKNRARAKKQDKNRHAKKMRNPQEGSKSLRVEKNDPNATHVGGKKNRGRSPSRNYDFAKKGGRK